MVNTHSPRWSQLSVIISLWLPNFSHFLYLQLSSTLSNTLNYSIYNPHFNHNTIKTIMFANVDPIYVRQVIGDVIDTITPCMNMKVYINGRQIINGCTIRPSIAIEPPRIRFEGQAEHLYTLVRIPLYPTLFIEYYSYICVCVTLIPLLIKCTNCSYEIITLILSLYEFLFIVFFILYF